MTRAALRHIRRSFVSDIAVVAALAGVVALEAVSVMSATDDLSMAPSGLVLDARGDEPAGVAIGEPAARFVNERLARRASPPGTVTTL
jgi:hypothetical protein